MSILRNRIEGLCKERGITGYRLCKDVGISPNIMTELKMGRRDGISAKTANKIASYFDVTVAYLLGEEEAPTPKDERSITFDDFTYAMHNETKNLSQEKKDMLLQMARFFNEELEKEKGEK